jgi:hypothetical protein
MRWVAIASVGLWGCGAAAVNPASTPHGAASESVSGGANMSAAPMAAPPMDAQVPMAPRSQAPSAIAAAGPAPVEAGKPAVRAEMLDIEANLTIEVDGVAAAAAALRAEAKRFDGIVVEDTLSEQASGATARLTIRVPTQRAERFLDAVDGVGRVRSRQVSARDIGKEYFDAELRLETLQSTIRRYEEILKQAKDVNEILRVESELARLRGDVEQTKGNLRWLGDRAARATVHVNLMMPAREFAGTPRPPEHPPEAKLYPGVRFTELTDLRGEKGNSSYLGMGLSARFSRHFALHVDALRESGSGAFTQGPDVVLLTLGGEMYSDFLGGGRRKFLNPYLGYALGYARFTGNNDAVIGISAGLEIWKTKNIVIDAEVRGMGLLFGSDGSHAAVQPVLGASIAF